MKRYAILALALVLCCAMLTGCRRGNGNMQPPSPTNEATTAAPTMPTVMPEIRPATEPAASMPTEPAATEDTTDSTGTTDATTENRSRGNINRPAAR